MTSIKANVPTELVSLLTGILHDDWNDKTRILVAADWCAEYDYPSLEWFLRWKEKNWDLWRWNSIWTGSRRYGTPRPDSDFDIVIYAPNQYPHRVGWKALRDHADTDSLGGACPEENYGTQGLDVALRFGPLNVILVSTNRQWASWITGTMNLCNWKPVTRKQAVAEFKKQFRKRGLHTISRHYY